jgi:hypothetical protein
MRGPSILDKDACQGSYSDRLDFTAVRFFSHVKPVTQWCRIGKTAARRHDWRLAVHHYFFQGRNSVAARVRRDEMPPTINKRTPHPTATDKRSITPRSIPVRSVSADKRRSSRRGIQPGEAGTVRPPVVAPTGVPLGGTESRGWLGMG